jgi:ABC-type transport system involved in multi-copper enzyme maturation permease subunit
MNAALVLARKEGGELLLGARGLAWLLAASGALSVFGLLLVSNSELSLLDNAQVVYDMAATITALGALLAVIVGSDAIAGERERGTLVPLLLTPLSRGGILAGKLGGQALTWAVIYVLALPYLWAVGSTGQNLAASMVALAVLGTPVVLGFGFFAMALSARLGMARSSLLSALICLMVSASPLLLGPGLRQSAIGKAFDTVNPFSAAVNAYDAIIIDSQTIGAQAASLIVVFIWFGLTLCFARRSFRGIVR